MTHSLLGIAIISVKDGGDISLDELREVIDMSETDLKPNDITERLNELGRYILNEPELRYTDVAEMANDIAADVVENATAITPRKPTIAVIPRRHCLRGMIHVFLFGLCF